MSKHMTKNKHTSLTRVTRLSKGHRLALTLAVLWALWTAHPAWAGDPVPRIDAINFSPPVLAYPGQPFDVEVRASNTGTDAEGGGSITISLPEGGDVSILDALAQVLFGLSKPGGRLPVDLPGLYPLGYGLVP